MKLSSKEGYTSRELERQINSGVFERVLLYNKKLNLNKNKHSKDLSEKFKDSYIFEFLNISKVHSEKDLQRSLVSSLKEFILELGRDFTFLGEEYRVMVGESDFYIDLLFYHRELQCLVAFELKIDKFKPEYLGQLEFYLEVLDRNIKKNHENPSIGVLLCRDKDDEVVEYALSRSLSPTVVSEYETKLIPKELLKRKIKEFYNTLEVTIEEE